MAMGFTETQALRLIEIARLFLVVTLVFNRKQMFSLMAVSFQTRHVN